MKKLLLIAYLLGASLLTTAQTTDSGNLVDVINTIGDNQPDSGTGEYTAATSQQLSTWGTVLSNLLDGNYSTASDTAATLDYELIEFTDTSETPDVVCYMLKSTGTNYWGTYVYNPSHTRAVIIQSPHPNYDYNTDKQGAYVFKKTGAAFFMMSGTHRCNNASQSTCAGTTGVCNAGVSTQFQISDMAHVEETPFHITTDSLLNKYSNTYFIQLHGFTKGGSDPYVIMSNGTADTPTTDYLVDLKNNLYAEDNALTFKLAHIDSGWTRLVGFTNTQGRMINGSGNPCNTSASTSTGRFLHVEQEKTKLRSDETGWTKMANAVTNTFPLSALPIELNYFNAKLNIDKTVSINWQTASEFNNDYFIIERSTNNNDWEEIGLVKGAGNSTKTIKYTFRDNKPIIGYSYYRLKQVDYDGQYSYSPIRPIYIKPTILIYPNPATSSFTIEVDNTNAITQIKAINSYGVTSELSYTISGNRILVNSSILNSGVYVINIVLDGANHYYKLNIA